MTVLHTTELDLLERLGGTRVDVHRAVVRATGRVVVVKHAPRDRTDAVAALAREAEALERVRHRSLVRLLGRVEEQGGCGLVLAHAAGGSLAARVAVDGPMPPCEVAELGAALAEALAALHRAGLLHRDVHPGNVLLDAELVPLLADLEHACGPMATARDPGDAPTARPREVVGHPDHIDPRLFAGAAPDVRADLHGLATTLWSAATGAPPARPGPDAPVRLEPGLLPPALEQVLAACLAGVLVDAAAVARELRTSALTPERTPTTRVVDRTTQVPEDRPPPSATTPAPVAASGTRRWQAPGLPPPPPSPRPAAATGSTAAGLDGPSAPSTSPRRTRLASAAGAALAVASIAALGVAVAMHRAGAAGAGEAGAGEAAVPVAVVAPAPCGPEPPGGAPGDPVLADLDGDGCSEWLTLHDGVLTSSAGRHALGEPGDVLLVGDWDADGRWTPGLHRRSTGEVFLLDQPPGPTVVAARPAASLAPGVPAVVTDADGDGRHEVVTDLAGISRG